MSKHNKKDPNLRNKLLVVAASVIALASLAYAAFSTTLDINGTGNISGNWNIQITSITKDTDNSVASTETAGTPSVGTDGLSATFNTDLAYPGAVAYYDLTVKNKGTINGQLTELPDLATINASDPEYVKYTIVSSPALNTAIAPDTTHDYRVKVEWVSTGSTNPQTLSKSATISFKYEQDTP